MVLSESLENLLITGPFKLEENRGKQSLKRKFQVTKNSSITIEFGSGFQNLYFVSFVFVQEANKSSVRLPNIFRMSENVLSESIHSVECKNFLFFCQHQYCVYRGCELLRSRFVDSVYFPCFFSYFITYIKFRTTHIINISSGPNCSWGGRGGVGSKNRVALVRFVEVLKRRTVLV